MGSKNVGTGSALRCDMSYIVYSYKYCVHFESSASYLSDVCLISFEVRLLFLSSWPSSFLTLSSSSTFACSGTLNYMGEKYTSTKWKRSCFLRKYLECFHVSEDLKLLLQRLKTFLKVAPEFISLTDLLLTDYIAKILIILCQFYHFNPD